MTIINTGKEDGWDNLTINIDEIENYTIQLEVNYVNVSLQNNIYNSQINASSEEYNKYVYWDESGKNLTLNLTSNSYANLTLTIIPDEEPIPGEIIFDLTVTSRTERVYTTTFVLATEEKN